MTVWYGAARIASSNSSSIFALAFWVCLLFHGCAARLVCEVPDEVEVHRAPSLVSERSWRAAARVGGARRRFLYCRHSQKKRFEKINWNKRKVRSDSGSTK